MALSTTTVQPQVAVPSSEHTLPAGANSLAASLLSLIFLSVYAGKRSRRQLRRIKRQMAWLVLREKLRSLFSPMSASDRKIITYILIGVVVLVLVFVYPIAALILALVALILLLTGTI